MNTTNQTADSILQAQLAAVRAGKEAAKRRIQETADALRPEAAQMLRAEVAAAREELVRAQTDALASLADDLAAQAAELLSGLESFADELIGALHLTAPEVREAVPVEMPAPSVAERLTQYVNHDRAAAPSIAQDERSTTGTDRETLLARARALIAGGASKTGAAKELGIPRTTLNDWLASADGAEVPSPERNGALPVS